MRCSLFLNPHFKKATEAFNQQLETLLLKSSNFSTADDFLGAFGIASEEIPLEGTGHRRGKAKTGFLSAQANCEPEMRTVLLDERSGNESSAVGDSNELLFPHCVRVPRCGGCCGLSDRLHCVPSKISYQQIRRARVRVRRDLRTNRGRPEASSVIHQVEVHDECRCECKVTAAHCLASSGQRYRADLCACECMDKKAEAICWNSSNKFWDKRDCSCRCKHEKQCSTGLVFNQRSCRLVVQ